jgi:gamma-butyrobetaine dioxygenase
MTVVTLEQEGQILRIQDAGCNTRFHGVWLRDNEQDAVTRDPDNGQRLITLADLPEDCGLSKAGVTRDAIHLTFAADGKTVAFKTDWLRQHAYDHPQDNTRGHLPIHTEIWNYGLTDAVPCADFDHYAPIILRVVSANQKDHT